MSVSIVRADAIEFLRAQPPGSLDLVLGSPPYMDARTYDDGGLPEGAVTVRGCQEWVDWMLDVTAAAVHACKGLVLWVVSGVQREKCYWPGCEGLAWEWWRRGNQLWRPCIWWKVDNEEGGSGIPGSGGQQWLRNDWEYVLAFKREGWLPWADPLVMGHEPVIPHLGGEMSNRTADGQRINDRVGGRERRQGEWGGDGRRQNGKKEGSAKKFYSRRQDGTRKDDEGFRPMPKIDNPGNCIIVKARVGGGHMGSRLCHDNEAPFPENLAAFFVRSFCKPGGTVCDPFSGSGTTAAVAHANGRNFLGCDLRQSQVDLSLRRVSGETPTMFP